MDTVINEFFVSYVLAQWHAAGLIDELLVVEDGLVPGQIQVLEDLAHPLAGVEDELLVRDHEAALGAHVTALLVHDGDGLVPLHHALPVGGQVEAGYRHLPRYDGVHGGAAVADHEYELGVGEEVDYVRAHLQSERVLVA